VITSNLPYFFFVIFKRVFNQETSEWSNPDVLHEVSCVDLHRRRALCMLGVKEGHGDYD
jgi:hypothetical protein